MPEFVSVVLELVAAVLLALMVCALAGAIAVALAWLDGAPGSALPWWFAGAFGAALLSIAGLFLWEQRQ